MDDQVSRDSLLHRISEFDVERRKRFVGLDHTDLARVSAIKSAVIDYVDEHVAAFFDYLAGLSEGSSLFARRELLEEARRLKRDHLLAMVDGDYGKGYVEQRIRLGLIYSFAGVDARIFLGAFHHLLALIGDQIARRFPQDPQAAFDHFRSLSKIANFDLGVILDVLIAERERTILRQQEAIRELSTPALRLRDRLLVLPIIGVIDSHRAKQLTDELLRAVRAERAKVVVMDVTGVPTIDSRVANHLLQTVAASRLMGATVIVTGLSADVAKSLVTLGVDLGRLNAVGDLQGGIEEAERMLGYELVQLPAPDYRPLAD